MSTNPFQQVTVRGQRFWLRTSMYGRACKLYQAVGAGNQDGPSTGAPWVRTAAAALEGLRQREEQAAREAAAAAAPKASVAVIAKAQRLGQGNRVVILSSFHALVIGDHATYDVTKFGEKLTCNCKWGLTCGHRGPCSHILAVQAATPESQAPVAKLAALLNDGIAKRHADAQAWLAEDKAELDALFKIA